MPNRQTGPVTCEKITSVPSKPSDNRVTVCPHCDLLVAHATAPAEHTASCPRCGQVLSRRCQRPLLVSLALAATALLLFLPSITLPLISLETFGIRESATVIDTITAFAQDGPLLVMAMVFLFGLLAPLATIILLLVVCLLVLQNWRLPLAARLFRLYCRIEEWAMAEIYFLAILITIFKMQSTTTVSYHYGFFFYLGLVFVTRGMAITADRHYFWRCLAGSDTTRQPPVIPPPPPSLEPGATALSLGYGACPICHTLQAVAKTETTMNCPCCGQRYRPRKSHMASSTCALLATAVMLLIPANLLPIMRVDFFGIAQYSTILDGIRHFLANGSYGIGIIILTASVLVPFCKIAGLSLLLAATRSSSLTGRRTSASLFRWIVFIGRWSMLDVFVIALLIALVDFGVITTIYPAPAATYFCLAVVFTMLAANTFDPRLLWDRLDPPKDPQDQTPVHES